MTDMQVRRIASEFTGAYFTESHTRTMVRVNVCRNLKDKACKLGFIRLYQPLFRLYRTWAGRYFHKAIQQLLHAEVIQRRAEEHRSQVPFQVFIDIKFGIYAFYQFQIVAQFFSQRCANVVIKLFGMDIHFHLLRHHLLGRLEQVQFLLINVIHTLETRSALDRPGQGAYIDNEFFFQLVQQVERVFSLTVHFVDEDNHRRVAHTAHFHQLACLRFHTFRPVHHDDYTIHRRKRTVCILRKVLVTGSIQNVHLIVMIIKLHHRCSDRNTTLLLNIHPVGGSGLLNLIRLYSTCHLNLPSEKQQFFRQRSLTGIRMCNNRKCSSSFYFLICHISYFSTISV